MNNRRRVYSTDTGRICPACDNTVARCVCRKKNPKSVNNIVVDGIIRIMRETKGRKGKTVTTVQGFDLEDVNLKKISARLKSCCGTGGSIKSGIIVIQGDHREAIKVELAKQGYRAKIAGG